MGYSASYTLEVEKLNDDQLYGSTIEDIKEKVRTQQKLTDQEEEIFNNIIDGKIKKNPDPYDIIEHFREEYEDAAFAIDDDGGTNNSTKWFDSDGELKRFSKLYPNYLFTLNGLGEDGERWQEYFVNGKRQYAKCIIKFEEFDPAKLQ